jgi:site-specific DNA-methyltransferase (adenine-specific)
MSYRQLGPANLHVGDCLDVMRELADCSVDSIVTDPPYGLGFMGKAWDDLPPSEEWAKQCLRVLKPGGHLLAFGGSRTWHRLAVAVEDAGFEIRDSIAWLYGSGFPKSLDVSKAIDKAAGADREVIGERVKLQSYGANETGDVNEVYGGGPDKGGVQQITAPATDDAKAWQGWGTALKPAFEPIVVGRKPLVGTVAANVLAHGTGALNIDGCRVETADNPNGGAYSGDKRQRDEYASADSAPGAVPMSRLNRGIGEYVQPPGRWPANVVLDESQAAELDAQSGTTRSGQYREERGSGGIWAPGDGVPVGPQYGDSGGASRFFPTFKYQAKAPSRERPKVDGVAHPTVKPLELMRWPVRLVTPPGGTVLEPFAGSGTTVEACLLENVFCVAIERDPSYVPLILHRVERVLGMTPGWLSR